MTEDRGVLPGLKSYIKIKTTHSKPARPAR